MAGGHSSWAQPMPGSKARCLRTAWASWPGSAARLCPPWWGVGAGPAGGQGDRGLCGERGVIGGRGRGRASGRVSVRLSEAYLYPTLLSPPPPPLVFQTVSINKAINTQVVAVKEKHARNILLEVAPKTGPEGNELMGTEVRARRPCSAAGTGTPSSQAPAGSEYCGLAAAGFRAHSPRGGRDQSSHPAQSRPLL